AGEIESRGAAVEELHEVVREGSAGVSAAAVELADDDARRGAVRERGGEQCSYCEEGEGKANSGHGQLPGEKDEGLSSIRSPARPKVSFRDLCRSWHDSVTLTRASSGFAAPACGERAVVRVR